MTADAEREATLASSISRKTIRSGDGALKSWQDLREHMRESRGGDLVIDMTTPYEQLVERAARQAVCVLEDMVVHHPLGRWRTKAAEVLLQERSRGGGSGPPSGAPVGTNNVLTREEAVEVLRQRRKLVQVRMEDEDP